MALSANELITQYKSEFDFCEKEYMKAWNAIIIDVDENASESKKTAARREAQKKANEKYRANVKRFTLDFPPTDAELWEHLQKQTNKQKVKPNKQK